MNLAYTKTKVGLIYGGKSGEHEVSLQTALAVTGAFDLNRYDIYPYYICKQGTWTAGEKMVSPPTEIEQLILKNDQASFSPLQSLADQVDVAFPLLHGTFGEDGTIQGLFEMMNLPYVGAGVVASSVGMDKTMMKRIFSVAEIPQCVYRYFSQFMWNEQQDFYITEIEVAIGYPCFVKPANLGSSVGITKVMNREQLIKAIEFAFQYDRKVVIEEEVVGREIEVGILGNDNPEASVVGEIVSSNEFYDYKAKYTDGKSTMVIPAQLDPSISQEIQTLAIRAYESIEATGLSRVDFFVRDDDGQILINEINTMPGFTPFSMYPLLWKESGVSYSELLERLVTLAFERYEQKQGLTFSID